MTQRDVVYWGKIWLGSADGTIPYFSFDNAVSDSFGIEVIFEIMQGGTAHNAGIMLYVGAVSTALNSGPNYYLGINPEINRVFFGYQNNGSWDQMIGEPYDSDFNQIYKITLSTKGSYHNVSINDTMVIHDQDFYDNKLSFGSIGLRTFNANATYYSLKFLG